MLRNSIDCRAALIVNMLGVPISVWGTLFCLTFRRVTSLHSTASINACCSHYIQALASLWNQVHTSHPALHSFRQQITAISTQAKAELLPIFRRDLDVLMAYSNPPRCVLAVAEIAVLLFIGPQRGYWRSFLACRFELFRWLRDFDPLTPSFVRYLPALEVFLTNNSVLEQGKVWESGMYFYKFSKELWSWEESEAKEMQIRWSWYLENMKGNWGLLRDWKGSCLDSS